GRYPVSSPPGRGQGVGSCSCVAELLFLPFVSRPCCEPLPGCSYQFWQIAKFSRQMRELHADEENSAGQARWIRSRIVPASGLLNHSKRPAATWIYEHACLMDSNSIPAALLMAGGIALLLATLPTLLGRK